MRRVGLALAGLVGLLLVWLLAIWPPPVWYRTHWPARTAFMSMRGREPLEYRPVPLDSIAAVMQDAVMIGEDSRFLTHGGVDYLALAQALGYERQTLDWKDPKQRHELLALLPQAWRRRDRLRGASTITQQLAKNLYLSPSRNPLRKLKEAVIAWRLEAALGKRRVMELYLNVVELGPGIWGVEAASRKYFNRGAGDLSEEQAAALAGSLPFPLRSNPGYRPGRMAWRQALILRRLHGEEVEVPQVEETLEPDSLLVSGDSIPPLDSMIEPSDSFPAEGDSSAGPGPADSTPPREPVDSGVPPSPPDSAR